MDPILFETPKASKRRVHDTETGDLFARPAVRSETSQAAAKAASPEHVARQRERARLIYEAAGPEGIAAFQLAAQLHVEQHSVTSTIDALAKARVIVRTDRKILNPYTKQRCFVCVSARYATAGTR